MYFSGEEKGLIKLYMMGQFGSMATRTDLIEALERDLKLSDPMTAAMIKTVAQKLIIISDDDFRQIDLSDAIYVDPNDPDPEEEN